MSKEPKPLTVRELRDFLTHTKADADSPVMLLCGEFGIRYEAENVGLFQGQVLIQ